MNSSDVLSMVEGIGMQVVQRFNGDENAGKSRDRPGKMRVFERNWAIK
jgi:hypothetical protein